MTNSVEDQEAAGHRSSADLAYEVIQRLIIIGEIPPYELLSESDLTRRSGCGRTPVREALQRLKFEGFVSVLPRRGTMVTPVDINRQLELLETRRPMERLMVELAAQRATESQRTRMRRLADELEDAISKQDKDRYLSINSQIHEIEADASHNRYLSQQIRLLHGLSRRFWYSFISETDTFAQAAAHHAATLRAIADGDPKKSALASSLLLDLLEEVSKKAIRERSNIPTS